MSFHSTMSVILAPSKLPVDLEVLTQPLLIPGSQSCRCSRCLEYPSHQRDSLTNEQLSFKTPNNSGVAPLKTVTPQAGQGESPGTQGNGDVASPRASGKDEEPEPYINNDPQENYSKEDEQESTCKTLTFPRSV
jgi:hypothetical protein